MKKTLLITYFFPPQIGGIENYYRNLCQRLGSGEIAVLAQDQKDAGSFDAKRSYPIYRHEFFGGIIRPKWLVLRKIIREIIKKEGTKQLIFGHFHPFSLLGAYSGLPYFIFGHGTDIRKIKSSAWQKSAFKKAAKHSRGLVFNSNYLANEAREILGNDFPKEKIIVIYPGVDIETLNKQESDISEEKNSLGISDGDLVMLSMGRLSKNKNYSAIIEIMPELLESLPNLKYIIVGDGPELEKLKNLVEKLGMQKNAILAGKVSDESGKKSAYYKLADMLVGVSTDPEGFGVSYTEAQACGVPVIASKIGGSAEAVVDGETGLLVDSNDKEAIKSAILKLAGDKILREKFSQAGIKNAEENFDWKIQIEKFKKLLS